MAYLKDLREHIRILEENGKLVRIKRRINKDTELMPLCPSPVPWPAGGRAEAVPGHVLTTKAKVIDNFIRKDRKWMVIESTTKNERGETVVVARMTGIWAK